MAYKTIEQVIEGSTLKDTGAEVEKIITQTSLVSESVSRGVSDVLQAASDTLVLALDTKWAAISTFRPAKTEGAEDSSSVFSKTGVLAAQQSQAISKEFSIGAPDRFERTNLCSLRLGDYWMPMSQTFTLRAKKRFNVSSLVDGIDIIQQTRKEAKTIDCNLRITLRKNQENLEVLNDAIGGSDSTEGGMVRSLATFAKMLTDLYEADAVFKVENQVINDVFGVNYAIISEYEFRPKVRSNIFDFNLSLTEVEYGDNVITFDARTLGGA